MSFVASLFAVLIIVAARVAVVRSKYFREHVKDLPQIPFGL